MNEFSPTPLPPPHKPKTWGAESRSPPPASNHGVSPQGQAGLPGAPGFPGLRGEKGQQVGVGVSALRPLSCAIAPGKRPFGSGSLGSGGDWAGSGVPGFRGRKGQASAGSWDRTVAGGLAGRGSGRGTMPSGPL